MGGLDLRYIVSYDLGAAKKVERIYTIATPHKGSGLAWVTSILSDAGRDLTIKHMKTFNKLNPYSHFKVDKNQIPLLALRFACAENPNEDDDDYMVEVKNQTYKDAPYSERIYHGKHMPKAECVHGYEAEQEQDWLIESILDDNKKIQDDGTIYTIPKCYYSDIDHGWVCD